ncbi:MAG: glycosyltransferase [Candidatus Omnitrophota bacterium]
MDKIKISICMPTRNRAGFIGQALESIISQAGDSVEIVIVDGDSQDNTQEVVRGYQNKFKNLVYCRQEKNGGVDRDMAKAIELAHGQYCWLFSDDDALKPGAIKRILKEIESGYEIYLCNVTACDLDMKPVRDRFWLSAKVNDRVFNLHEKDDFIEYCDKANSIGALFSFWSSVILNRQEWNKSGYNHDFDGTAYASASVLLSFIKSKCRLKYIKSPLVLWRNDNKSFQDDGGLVDRFLLDFNGYSQLADKYLSDDRKSKDAFLKVMSREHPWYTIIHAASHIDSGELWAEFNAKLLKFKYNPRMVKAWHLLSRFKRIVTIGVKIKRAIIKKQCLNEAAHWLCSMVKYSWKQILQITPLFNYLLVFNVFGGAFTILRQPFEFNLGYLFIIFFLTIYIWRNHSLCINSSFLVVLIIFTILSLLNVYLGNDTVFLLVKQVSGILITGVAYYLLVKINNYDINKLFKIYLQIALIVAVIGIFQELSYLVGFKMGYDFKWMWMMNKWGSGGHAAGTLVRMLKVNSIFLEPAHFAVTMAPAFLVSFLNIFKKNPLFSISKWGSILIFVSYILTFSLVAYIAIVISILIVTGYKGLRHLILIMTIILILAFGAYSFLPDINMRINGIIAFAIHPSVSSSTHMSVYAVVSNAFIAFSSFINNFLFGMGLGSHPVSYDKFYSLGVLKGFLRPTLHVAGEVVEVCKGDSGSLFLRLLSETGLFGIIVVFYFIFRFRLKMKNNHNLQIISNGIFLLFTLYLLRQAHYFYNGLFFFVWVYYFAYKVHNKTNPGILTMVR